MRNRISTLIKMDSDEKSDGQGFVLVGDPAPEEPIVEDRTTYTPETQGQNTPYTSETQDQNTPYTAETQDQNTPPVVEKMTETETLFGDKPAYGSVGSQEPPRIHKSQTGNGANKKISKNVLVIILALLLGFGGGFGGGILAIQNFGGGGSGSNVTVNAKGESLNVTEAVAKKVLPSVVGITATTTTVSQDIFFGPQQQVVSGVGTGIILDTSGYILTNSHVIMDDSKTKLTVLLSDGREVSGSVKWFDTTLDLAIVKISAANLTPAEMGNSDNLKVGQYVAAIGNPLGLEFQGSVTQGVISGLNRTIVATNDNNTEVSMENLVQVDAAINAGNSGGPLLNSSGQVIGINTAKAESGENMGFAIPIDTAKPIIDSIKATGEFNRVYMGVSVTSVSDVLANNSGVDLGTTTGAYIAQVSKGSPAEAAGLKAKDVIVEVDGNKIKTRNDLINLLLRYKSGDTISVNYYRNGHMATTKVKLTNTVQQ